MEIHIKVEYILRIYGCTSVNDAMPVCFANDKADGQFPYIRTEIFMNIADL